MSEKIFVNGMIVKKRQNAPDFVIANVSFKFDDFIAFLNSNAKNGWLNVDIKKSKGGNLYAELNTWTKESPKMPSNEVKPVDTIEYPSDEQEVAPEAKSEATGEESDIINPEEIPF